MYSYRALPEIDFYRRYPDSFLVGLSKIGGLVGLLYIFEKMLYSYHKWKFENQVLICETDCESLSFITLNNSSEKSSSL